MFNKIHSFLFLLFLSIVSCQIDYNGTCKNPLLKFTENPNGIINRLSVVATAANTKFCSNVNNTDSCCSSEEIDKLSAVIDNIKSNITQFFKENDLNITISRAYFNKMVKDYEKIQKTLEEIIAKVKTIKTGDTGSNIDFSYLDSMSFEAMIPPNFESFNKRTNKTNINYESKKDKKSESQRIMKNVADSIKDEFKNFQKARKQCFESLIKTYSKFYCLACESDSTKFFKDKKLKISKNLCNSLMNSCYDYLSLGEIYSGFNDSSPVKNVSNMIEKVVVYFDEFKDVFSDVVDSINKLLENKDESSLSNFNSSIKKLADLQLKFINITQDNPVRPVRFSRFPIECKNKTECVHICTKFINLNGVDLNTALYRPGIDELQLNRLLLTINDSNGVLYSDEAGYDVEKLMAGIEESVVIKEDPAEVADKEPTDIVDTESGSSFNVKFLSFGIFNILILFIIFN